MASIFKAKYPKTKVVNGKRVTVCGRDGKPIYRDATKWTIQYIDADGHRRLAQGFTGKIATMSKMTEVVRAVERQKAGITDVPHERLDQGQRTLKPWKTSPNVTSRHSRAGGNPVQRPVCTRKPR